MLCFEYQRPCFFMWPKIEFTAIKITKLPPVHLNLTFLNIITLSAYKKKDASKPTVVSRPDSNNVCLRKVYCTCVSALFRDSRLLTKWSGYHLTEKARLVLLPILWTICFVQQEVLSLFNIHTADHIIKTVKTISMITLLKGPQLRIALVLRCDEVF